MAGQVVHVCLVFPFSQVLLYYLCASTVAVGEATGKRVV